MKSSKHGSPFASAAIVALFLFVANGAHGSIVFDNGAMPTAVLGSTLSSSDATSVVRAEDFILAADATITGVQWTGSYAGANVHADDDFTLQFFANNPADATHSVDRPQDLPNFITSISVGDANRTVDAIGLFHYSATIAPLSFVAGTRFWVSIFNDASDETGTPVWAWAGTNIGVTLADIIGIRNQVNTWGSGIGFQLDLRLEGEFDMVQNGGVPEATSLAVWGGLCLAGVMASRRFFAAAG